MSLGPKPYAVVYDTDLGLQYVFESGSIQIPPVVVPVLPTVINSSATTGGAATEEVTVTGLRTTSTIWAVTQVTPGSNSLPLLGWVNDLNGSLHVTYSADMGPGAVVRVVFIP